MQRKTMKTINSLSPSQSQWNYFLSLVMIKIGFWITLNIIKQDSTLISNNVPSKCFAVASYGYLGNLHNTSLDLKATDTKRNFFNKPENMIQYPKVILYCRQTQLNTPPLRYRHKKKLLKPENMRAMSRSHFILPKKTIKYICKVWVPMFSFSY